MAANYDYKNFSRTPMPFWVRLLLLVMIVIAALLLAARLYLPHFVQSYANETLDRNPNYDGSIGEVDIRLLAGAYRINDIELRLAGSPESSPPLFRAEGWDFSMQWSELWRGKLVAETEIDQPEVHLRMDQLDRQTEDVDAIWQEQVQELFPFELNRLRINDGVLHFRNPTATPELNISLTGLTLEANNLTNVETEGRPLPATVDAWALVENQAPLQMTMRLAPLALSPTFTLNARLDTLRLRLLNDYFAEYAKLSVEAGTLTLVSEIAAANDRFQGYITPALVNLEVTSVEDAGLLQEIWGALARGLTTLLENPNEEQVATRVPFRGTIENPEVGIWALIINLLQNAFVQAIQPGFEGIIGLQEVIQLQRGEGETIDPAD